MARCSAILFVLLFGFPGALSSTVSAVDGTYALFNLTKLYLPIGVGFSYANISAKPSAFLSSGGDSKAIAGVSRQQDPNAFFDAQSPFCPKRLVLKLSEKTIDFPDGLKDPSGYCKPADGFMPVSQNVVDAGNIVGTFIIGDNLPSYIEKKTLFLFAKVPFDVLKCPDASSKVPPFAQLSINFLAQQLVSIIKASGIAMRIPLTILDRVFGKVRQMSKLTREKAPPGWNEEFLRKTTATLRNALTTVKGTPMMVLKPNSKDAGNSGLQNLECYYVRESEKAKINDVSKRLEELTMAMVGFMVQSAQKTEDVRGLKLYASDARCGTLNGNNPDFINSIEFPKDSTPVLPPVGKIRTKLIVDEQVCADAIISRWIDIGTGMKDSKRTVVPNRIVEFFKKNSRFGSIATVMLSSILSQLGTLAPFGFSEQLQEATTKTAILHVEVDPSKCEKLKNKNKFDFLIVKDYGVSGFFCKSFPGGPNITTPLCDSTAVGSSAFLVRSEEKNKTTCLFSSDKHAAALFLNVGTSKSPSEPAYKTATPSPEPINPKSRNGNTKKACFPAMATVRKRDGREVTMYELRVGDEIEVDHGKFEPVLAFTHAIPTSRTDMVMIASKNGSVVISPSHYIYLNKKINPAGQVRIGDLIPVRSHRGVINEEVINIKTVSIVGLYNPQTPSGKIFVRYGSGNPILVTTYTTAIPYGTAHSLLGPLRTAHSALGLVLPRLSNLFLETKNVVPGSFVAIDDKNSEEILNLFR